MWAVWQSMLKINFGFGNIWAYLVDTELNIIIWELSWDQKSNDSNLITLDNKILKFVVELEGSYINAWMHEKFSKGERIFIISCVFWKVEFH